MSALTLTPRLRNSSINGIRFQSDLDPIVKKHLTELDKLLGSNAFSEKTSTRSHDLDSLSKDYETAKEEANAAEAKSTKADEDAEDADRLVAKLREGAKGANGTESKSQAKAESAKQGGEEKNTDNLAQAEKDAASKRTAATNLKQAFNQKQGKAENLEKLLAAKSLLVFTSAGRRRIQFDLENELAKPLVAKKTNSPKWDPLGILDFIISNNGNQLSISDCIDRVNELSTLKNTFQQYLIKNWNFLNENQKAVLDNNQFKNIPDYLLAYGYWVKGITEVSAMFNFIKTHASGANAVVKYATISAAREIVEKSSLEIPDTKDGINFDDDKHPLIQQITKAGISFSGDSFSKESNKMFKAYIESGTERGIIKHGLKELQIDEEELPASYIPLIIQYMRSSKVIIDEENIEYFLPIFINKVKGDTAPAIPDVVEDPELSDKDFEVVFIEDEKDAVITSVSNVLCASQLFSAAIMEMDLDIFNLTDYLTNNYLIRNRIDLVDQRLRQNLQLFVFSNEFIDIKTGQTLARTKPGERQHFYRQVFNVGSSAAPEGIIVNYKFPKLWKQLIPEVKNYLENAASSLSENTFVSKGGVMQVVSGLQNNLSAQCTGMAKIISPIINGEWNFIISKILGHPEIVRQVSPAVASWKGVAETLLAEMKQSYTDASLVYDKVRISNAIIRKIAEFEPRKFEEDETFMEFCSMVIQLDDINNSMVMEAYKQTEEEVDEAAAPYIPRPNGNGSVNGTGNNSDWDF